MTRLRGSYALDASVLIEILAGSSLVKDLVEAIVSGDGEAYAARLSLTEALYVTCRLWGLDEASRRMNMLLGSRLIAVIEDRSVWRLAASCKCRVPVSLGDCYTLAAAKAYGLRPLFLRPERELVRHGERVRRWLGADPVFLVEG